VQQIALIWVWWWQGDVVVIQGDIGDQMYFISEGELEVRIYQQPSQLREPPQCCIHLA
jgi:CRP-like cAMP-binding protein